MIRYKKNEKQLTKREIKNLELIFSKPKKEQKNDEQTFNENQERNCKSEK